MAAIPTQSPLFAKAAVKVAKRADGSMVWTSPQPLGEFPDNLCRLLHHWAENAPERIFLAERQDDGSWRRIDYRGALHAVRAIATALLERGLNEHRPVMLLSDNGVDNALMQFGCLYAGIPVVPVSPAYSLLSQDHGKLRHIFGLVDPGLVFTVDGRPFAAALGALDLAGRELVVSRNPPEALPSTAFAVLTGTPANDDALDAASAAVGPDTVAKILFTSGSTGTPKGVLNTHRMLCSNQQAISQVWPFLAARPPVIVDWLPWHHTFGGNHNLNMMLWHGGTLYIDNGKPAPGLIERTLSNLREIPSTIHFNVPRGFDMILPSLERDEALREIFFRDLDLIFYAAAALPQNLWERLENVSTLARGRPVPMTSAWGATETGPCVTTAHFPIRRAGNIGLPIPGTELKFVPQAGKLELRVRGPQVTPGYFRQPELTRAAFDDDGFYRIGDAGIPADEQEPAQGVVFDGRVAEDFKLLSGTWVNVGALRVAIIAACAPVVQDAVICGHDRDEIGVLVFANPVACAQLAQVDADTSLTDLIAHPAVAAAMADGLARHNVSHPQSSTRVTRALLLDSAPRIDADEITDKGYVNQRAVLAARASEVERLYRGDAAVILPRA